MQFLPGVALDAALITIRDSRFTTPRRLTLLFDLDNTLHDASRAALGPTSEAMTRFGEHRRKPDARMFRQLLARMKLTPSRCVLVEDTLAHQRSARRVGMRTAWMQRYLRGAIHAAGPSAEVGVHPCHKPAY